MDVLKIKTIDSLESRYFPIAKSQVRLSVQAAHDARITLRTHLGDDSCVYEIIIGGWVNTMSAIKRNDSEPHVTMVDTKDIINADRMSEIWIKWFCDGVLSVGRNDEESFMTYKDSEPFLINYIGVSTAWGATGEWWIEGSLSAASAVRQQLLETCKYWVDCTDTLELPGDAVSASADGLYVGRACHEEAVTPGGVRGTVCQIAWGGSAHEKKQFQVLCGKDVHWVKSWQGSVPLHALPAGETEDGCALFIGRIVDEGVYYVGKIQPKHQVCYIPLNGQEVAFEEYEVLVINDCSISECIGR